MTASASMRLIMPASTLPGPHSTTWVTPRARIACTDLDPAHRAVGLAIRARRGSPRGRSRRATSMLLMTGICGAAIATLGQPLAQPLGGRLHQARMERRRHRQRQRALRARRLEQLAGLVDAGLGAGDHGLLRIVEVDRLDDLAARRARPRRSRRAPPSASRPRIAAIAPTPTGTASCIACGAKAHQRQRVGKRQRAGGDQRACTRRASGRPPTAGASPVSASQAR